MVNLGEDDGIEQIQEVMDRLSATKTRLARTSYLDESDIGLSYTRALLVLNKIDAQDAEERIELLHELCDLDFEEIRVSATEETGLETLRNKVYEALDVVRVYTKLPTSKEPDHGPAVYGPQRPYALVDLARQVHKDYAEGLKFARVWGNAVHDGTVVKGDYVLHDKDIVELHL